MPPADPQASTGKTRKIVLILAILAAGGVVLCAAVGVLAAIAIPNFIRYQGRARQEACKATLLALDMAETTHRAGQGAYSSDPAEIGFSHAGTTRYTCFLGDGHVVPATDPQAVQLAEADLPPLAGPPQASSDAFTAVCAGNIDGDPDLDVWSISSAERAVHGVRVEADRPFQERDDLR